MFSQLLDFLDRDEFNYLARKYGGDKYVKQFTCYNQLCVLIFGQLSNRESLRDVILATQAHASTAYHLGFGKHAAKSTLADANTKRDYRIFEEFAYKVIAEAQRCRIVDIFKLNGNVYAFDSTTVDLCLSTFEWALFRKRKGGIKMHTLYNLETRIPTFFHIIPARVHDTKAMDVIPYEENSFYIFDRGYNDFERLHNIESIGAYFVIRGRTNNDFKPMKWKRRFPTESGIQSDAFYGQQDKGYVEGQECGNHKIGKEISVLGYVCLIVARLGNEASEMECERESDNGVEYIHGFSGYRMPYNQEKESENGQEVRGQGNHKVSDMVLAYRKGHHPLTLFSRKRMDFPEEQHTHNRSGKAEFGGIANINLHG